MTEVKKVKKVVKKAAVEKSTAAKPKKVVKKPNKQDLLAEAHENRLLSITAREKGDELKAKEYEEKFNKLLKLALSI